MCSMMELFSSIDSSRYDIWASGENAILIFNDIMTNTMIRNYLVATANGNYTYLISSADRLVTNINSTIEMIDKEVEQ